jgi:hypothetical protein
MNLVNKTHVLITGSHRSGSTWVGRTICESPGFIYVDEPFNIGKDHKHSPFRNQFEYLYGRTQDEQAKAKSYLDSFSALSHGLQLSRIGEISSKKDLRRLLSDIKSRISRRYIFKDPLALMSAEWIYQHYDWQIVVLVRHPAAFVASLKVKDWQFNFNYFKNQPTLVHKHLRAYADKIERYSRERPDIIRQGILLWNILNSMVLYYQEKFDNQWYFVRHEVLSEEPLSEYEKLYEYLGIEFDDTVRNRISTSTSATEVSLLERNSQDNIKTWKERLTKEEIDLIYKETQQVWKNFYTDEDW